MSIKNIESKTITPEQCRAAREMLNWKQDHLAKLSGTATATIGGFETKLRKPMQRTLRDIRYTFEEAGIKFIDDENENGVSLIKKRTPQK